MEIILRRTLARRSIPEIPRRMLYTFRGLEYLGKGNPQHGGSVLNGRKALKVFSQAVQKDPRFALAYLGQADALALTASFTSSGTVPVVKIYRQQEAAALKAIELDDSLPRAHASRRPIFITKRNSIGLKPKRNTSASLNYARPPPAYTSYATFLASMGRFEEAEAQVKLAQAIDPKSFSANWTLMRIYYWQRKDDAALAQQWRLCKNGTSLGPITLLAPFIFIRGNFKRKSKSSNWQDLAMRNQSQCWRMLIQGWKKSRI